MPGIKVGPAPVRALPVLVIALAAGLSVVLVMVAWSDSPRRPDGRVAPLELRFGLYDDFDGNGADHPLDDSDLAVAGQLSPELWTRDGPVAVREHGSRGYVAELRAEGPDSHGSSMTLTNPAPVSLEEMGTFSADVLVPSGEGTGSFNVSLKLDANLPELDDPYWGAQISLSRHGDGSASIGCGWHDKVADQYVGVGVRAEPDRWYRLRMDVTRVSQDRLVVTFLVDDRLLFSGTPEQSAMLLDPESVDSGPNRLIGFWADEPAEGTYALVDAVNGVYDRLVLSSITPSSGLQGESFPVTIRGDGFREEVIPFATEWGVSFVDVEIVDAQTVNATALVDDLAPPGVREIVVGLPPTVYTASAQFEISEDPSLPPSDYAYGLYEDFDDPEWDGEWFLGWDTDASLVWWSVGHDQTYPVVTQEDGRLKLATDYDGERGYWLPMRLAEPEGPLVNEHSTLHIARSVSVDYSVPLENLSWWGPAIGMQGRYADGTWGVKWEIMLYLDRSDVTAPPAAGYWLGRVYHYHDPDDTVESINEQAGRFEGLGSHHGDPIGLRFDLVEQGDGAFLIDLFVNRLLKARVEPADAHRVWSEITWSRGPVRIVQAGAPLEEGTFTCSIDNIKAVHPLPWE